MVTADQIVQVIEQRQPVLNKLAIDGDIAIRGVGNLSQATKSQLAFLAQSKYMDELQLTQAGLVLISEEFIDNARQSNPDCSYVVVKDAYLAYACVSTLFTAEYGVGIHPSAVIDPSAKIGQGVSIGANAVISSDAVIGDGVIIASGAFIGERVCIGDGSHIDAAAVIHHDCVIGKRVRIHSHACIGGEGFGFAPTVVDGGVQWQRIAQLGRVVVGDDVRIGSNTCIDRGAVSDTVIEDHVIIDNLVQIAHNVHIGSGTAIAAKVGIAGSTKIGKNCIIGGAVGISGHLKIADHVTLTAMSMVISDIRQAGTYSSGTTAMPSQKWRRAAVRFRQMGEK